MEVADRRSDATKPPAAGVPRKIKEVKIMSSNEMDSKIKELRELRRMAEELATEIDSIQDTIKRHMDADCKGLLEEYVKETGGDLDKAAREWMEENIDVLYAAIRAAGQLLRDALDTMDNIPQKEVCNNA